MYGVDIMVEEHKYVLRMLKVMRNASYWVLKGKEVNYDDFHEIIDFVRNFADKHHHGKEEKFLFKEMQTRLGRMGENLITHGMMVEHDLGRLYMSDLEAALERVKSGDDESRLDVISNAVGYTYLLTRHIGKEDSVVYNFGVKNLPEEVLEEINRKTEQFENEANANGVRNHYIGMLERLEDKYNTK
jgi:hemerythrin-like domain-containing protein